MSSKVKRYVPTDTSHEYTFSFKMEEDAYGDYVKVEDYEKLKAQLERAEDIIERMSYINDKIAREYFKGKEQV